MAAAAFFSFLFAAGIGGFMAYQHSRGVPSGAAMGIVHGVFVLIGFAFLLGGLWFVDDPGWGWWLLAAFLATAAGGSYLWMRQRKGEPWPGLVLIAHGSAAVLSIVLLGLWLFSDPRPAGPDTPLGPAQAPADMREATP